MLIRMPSMKNPDNPLVRVFFLVCVDEDDLSFGERLTALVSDIVVGSVGLVLI